MNVEQTHELMFIIAKYLKTLFPDVAEAFIQRCESKNLFPRSVFTQTATFDELQTSFLAGVPDDQLIRIITHVQNNSNFSSLLASLQQSPSSNSNLIENNNDGNPKFFNNLLCDSIRNQIDPLETVIPPFHRFAAHHQIISHTDKIYCLAVDATSQVLITGSDDFLVKIWKIPEMIPMKMFNVHIDSISDLQIHPNNQYFCSSSHDSTITVFTFQDGGRVVLKLKMENMVHNIKFSPCGTFLGAASQEGCLSIWNFNEIIQYDKNNQNSDKLKRPKYSIEPIKVIYSPKKRPAAWLSFSPNGNFVAFSCDPNLVIVSSLNENYSVKLRGHKKCPDFVFFSKITCNRILSLSSKERGIRFWESQNDIWDKSILLTNTRRIHGATFNCDESRIIGVSTRMITVWDTESKQQLFMLTDKKYTDHAKFVISHPTLPAVVFVSTLKGRTSLWDIINGQLICGLQSEERVEINEAIWSPDGQYVFTSDALGGVTIYMADSNNKNRKVSDLVPYTEMFFHNELIELQENEDRRNESKVKENTYKDKSLFNQAYYQKVNSKNYEVDTLISDRIGNPLLPQPKRWFINDLNLKIAPVSIASNSDDEESIALNLMKALFTAAKTKKNTSSDMNEIGIDESTIVPILHEEKDRKNQSEDEKQNKSNFSDSNGSYESSSDTENIERRRRKSREEAEREREERLERRHRKLEESQNDSGFSSESSIASRRTRRQRNQKNEPKRKNLSSSSSSSTTNLLRRKSSRIKLNELPASNSSSGNSEDQEYEMNPLNEYEDENEEYEDEIEFEKEIEEEEEEEERHENHKKQIKNTRNNRQSTTSTTTTITTRSSMKTRSNSSKQSKTNTKIKPKPKTKTNIKKQTTKPTTNQQQRKTSSSSSSSLVKVKNQNNYSDDDDDDTLQSNSSSTTSSESSDLESTSVPVSAVSSSSLYRFNLPSWTFSVKRSIHTYIPQIGDEVVYLRKGHIDWKKECNFMHFTPPYQLVPDLPQVAEARISDIKFYVTHLVIDLQFYTQKVDNFSKQKKKNNFEEIVRKFALPNKGERDVLFEAKIAYPMPDSPQFIVKKSRFVYSMLYTLSLKSSDIVKVEFAAPEKEKNSSPKIQKSNQKLNEIDNDVKLFMGKVKSISQNWIKEPWQCINVIFTDDNKPGKLQPWELIFDEDKIKKDLVSSIRNIEKFNPDESDDDYDYEDEIENDNIVANDDKMDKMNDSLVHPVSEMLQVKENAAFVSIRSTDDQKILRRKSKFPVDLTLICDRLANRWYTSVESLKNDIQLIKSNSLVLDELNDKTADRIVDQLMKKIEPFTKAKNSKRKTKPKDKNSSESEVYSESDSEADFESGSESDTRKSSTLQKSKNEKANVQKKIPQKSSNIQTRNSSISTRRSITRQKSKNKDYDSDSSTISSASSTTSASSSVTTTSSDSE